MSHSRLSAIKTDDRIEGLKFCDKIEGEDSLPESLTGMANSLLGSA